MVKVIYTYPSKVKEEETFVTYDDALDNILEKWFEGDKEEMLITQESENKWCDENWSVEITEM